MNTFLGEGRGRFGEVTEGYCPRPPVRRVLLSRSPATFTAGASTRTAHEPAERRGNGIRTAVAVTASTRTAIPSTTGQTFARPSPSGYALVPACRWPRAAKKPRRGSLGVEPGAPRPEDLRDDPVEPGPWCFDPMARDFRVGLAWSRSCRAEEGLLSHPAWSRNERLPAGGASWVACRVRAGALPPVRRLPWGVARGRGSPGG